MRWYRTLTRGQRWILLGLLVGLITVLGLLGWNVWRAVSLPQTPSPLPTPTPRPTLTPSRTPTPTLTLTPSVTPTETPLPPLDIAQAGMIATGVSDARGRLARWSTPLTLVNDQLGMSVILYRLYDAYPPLVLHLQPHLKALRLWFWEEVRVDPVAQAPAVGALYASDTEELYLRRDWPGARDVLEWQIAYGYARAVPDQYGDLPLLIANADSLDHRLALAAVGDGDALFSLWRYAGAEPGSARAQALTDAIADATTPRWRLVADPLLDDLSQLSLTVRRCLCDRLVCRRRHGCRRCGRPAPAALYRATAPRRALPGRCHAAGIAAPATPTGAHLGIEYHRHPRRGIDAPGAARNGAPVH